MPDAEGHPARDEIQLVSVLAALADPLRLEVVQKLMVEADGAERHCTSFGLPVSKSTRSHHFKVLREAGLIKQVDRGNSRMAQLRRSDIESRFPGLLDAVATTPD
ncbi:helix-turn-helix transcriptional regulator [Rhodococcus sp. JVH1]|uniref:ArsR/SmtB family transcription factor n=1 Tax=Rhodococcus sp. JVH1 TaxID=745408 RepID=UPI000272219A|nr:ArsR family transcriptional regulator [Rhodococcus sp. JVH1]EJI99416.1 bacterial regulatory protein, arsR family protein [Rhodococcus sp. JVH1]